MKYYQVKTGSNDVRTNRNNQNRLVANELYTENETAKMSLTLNFIAEHFNPCQTSKFNTYYFFGARFAQKDKITYY